MPITVDNSSDDKANGIRANDLKPCIHILYIIFIYSAMEVRNTYLEDSLNI